MLIYRTIKSLLILLCLLLISYCLIPLPSFCQNQEEIKTSTITSTKHLFPDLTDIAKIDSLNSIAQSIYKDFPDSCKKLADITLSMSDSLDYQKGLAFGYLNLGRSYLYKDSLFPAMINLLKSERIYEEMDSSSDLR